MKSLFVFVVCIAICAAVAWVISSASGYAWGTEDCGKIWFIFLLIGLVCGGIGAARMSVDD